MEIAIDHVGRPLDGGPPLRVGAVGCGSHAYRNVFPSLPFLPARLVACCDLERELAETVAARHGAAAYVELDRMLAEAELDAVVIVTGYDQHGRPRYPALAQRCLAAGLHVWIEKPPAAGSDEIEALQAAASAAGRQVAVGLKKQYMPANRKALALLRAGAIGAPRMVMARYPQSLPSAEEAARWRGGERIGRVVGFLDHLCHPASLLVSWLGLPRSVLVERAPGDAGVVLIRFAGEVLAQLSLTPGAGSDGGMEHSTILGERGHIVVADNLRVELRRSPPGIRYGRTLDYYQAAPEQTSAVWEPEHSLGQLYTKGVVQLGYVDELGDFVRAGRTGAALEGGTLADAWAITALFETVLGAETGRWHDLPTAPGWVESTLASRTGQSEDAGQREAMIR